jgi:hypothetical protein
LVSEKLDVFGNEVGVEVVVALEVGPGKDIGMYFPG